MNRKATLLAAFVLAASAAGVAIAAGGGGDNDNDQGLTGSALDQAKQAALAHTGGGTVVDTEGGDDGAVYGVEIQLPDGSQVEVELDGDFNVVGQEADDDSAGEDDGPNDD